MIYLTIGAFALAAVIGAIILKNWMTSSNTSKTVVYGHGAFAALGLVLLLFYVLDHPGDNLQISLVLFAVAAIGGFYMFVRDLKGKFSPMWLAVSHALVAVAGFVFLLLMII